MEIAGSARHSTCSINDLSLSCTHYNKDSKTTASMQVLTDQFKKLSINETSSHSPHPTENSSDLHKIYKIFYLLIYNCIDIDFNDVTTLRLTRKDIALSLGSNPQLIKKIKVIQFYRFIQSYGNPKSLENLFFSRSYVSCMELNILHTWANIYPYLKLKEKIQSDEYDAEKSSTKKRSDIISCSHLDDLFFRSPERYCIRILDTFSNFSKDFNINLFDIKYSKKIYKYCKQSSIRTPYIEKLLDNCKRWNVVRSYIEFNNSLVHEYIRNRELVISIDHLPKDSESALSEVKDKLLYLIGSHLILISLITEIRINAPNMTCLPSEISYFKNLEMLTITNAPISDLPKSLSQLQKLKQIDLSHNKINKLPKVLKEIRSLTKLSITNNRLSKIPSYFKDNDQFVSLDFNHNNLFECPSFLFEIPYLSQLNLSHNRIQYINLPKTLNTSIRDLDLSYNQIFQNAEQIFNLSHLSILNLSHNPLEQIPEISPKCASSLNFLSLNSCRLKFLPNFINCFKNLYILNCSKNLLSNIPEEFGNLKSLTNLSLNHNSIKDNIPKPIYDLRKLKYLSLENNGIKVIEDDIKELKNLHLLNISSNNLNSISRSIGALKDLSILTICNNFIRELPPTITRCTSLTSINISNNQLQTLPKQLHKLQDLQFLDCS